MAIVSDPDFLDSAKWEKVGFGVSVANGVLKYTLATSIRVAPIPDNPSVAGEVYRYNLKVTSVSAFGITGRVMIGTTEFWDKSQGTGTFQGTEVSASSVGLVFQANPAQYTVDFVQVQDVRDNRYNMTDGS